MKAALAICVVVLVGCATYQGPKASAVIYDCYNRGATVRQLSMCMSGVYARADENWVNDKDYPAIASFFTVTDALGEEVSAGRMTESSARIKAAEYLNMLQQQKYASEAQRQAQAAAFINAGVGMMSVQEQIRANEINSYNSTRQRSCTYQQVGSTIQQVCN